MMRGLLHVAVGSWVAPYPRWVALGASGIPQEVRTSEGYIVETVRLAEASREGYARFKETVWRSFHGPSGFDFPLRDYAGFVDYSHAMARAMLDRADEYDLFYINDFQQVLVGGLIGSAAPALLRWHIPLDFKGYPEPVRRFFLKAMEGFDAIVVSTRAGLEELIRAGFHGRAFQIYPYVDFREFRTTSERENQDLRARLGLRPEHEVILSVSRLDPVKRQDLLIDAFALVARQHPNARLLLVGGGSFSTQSLGSSGARTKADLWAEKLRRQIRLREVEDSVILAGSLSNEDLQAAYSTAQVFVHSAPWEGFGLVVVEAWIHKLPVVVSRGAGVAELIDDEANGFTFPPSGPTVPTMARRIAYLLDHRDVAERLGEFGSMTARRCQVQRAAPRIRDVFERTMRLYEWSGLRPRRGISEGW